MFREKKRRKQERFSNHYCLVSTLNNEKNLSEVISKKALYCINHLQLITEINYYDPNQEKRDLILILLVTFFIRIQFFRIQYLIAITLVE